MLNLIRGGILFLIETSGLFKFLFDVTNSFMVSILRHLENDEIVQLSEFLQNN